MWLVIPEKFQLILRIINTNIDGKIKVMFTFTAIKSVGRRFFNVVLKKGDVNVDKRAGEYFDEKLTSSVLDSKFREDLERLKKIRTHKGERHFWGLRVRGQHTKATGRRRQTVGFSKKK